MITPIVDIVSRYLNPFPYTSFIIYTSVLIYAFQRWLDWRQYGKLSRTERPEYIKKLVDEKDFTTSQSYGRSKLQFSFVRTLVAFPIDMWCLFNMIMFWNIAGNILNRIGYEGTLVQSLLFMYLQHVLDVVIDLPFSYYYDFVLEAKHGFNKKTLHIFVTDKIKTHGLTIVIGGPCMAVFLKLLTYDRFVLYVNIFLLVFSFIMMQIYPTLIWPLFNKFESVTKEGLKDDIEKLCNSVSYPLTGLYQIDGSKRSGHSNAMLYGFCNSKRIVLYDTIIDQLSNIQVVAVLCHELGHWQYWHTIQGFVINQVQVYLILSGFTYCFHDDLMYQTFGFKEQIPIIGFTIYSRLLEPVNVVLTFLIHAVQRLWEFQADSYAVDRKMGKELIESLEIISKENKSSWDPDQLYATFHYTHPPIANRLANIGNMMKKSK